jgi:chitodextrinase
VVGLSASAASSSQINLAWTAATDNVGVTGYEVWRCQGASCSTFGLVGTPTGTTFNDTGLSASTSYSYKVRAKDAAGNLGPFSAVVSQSTNAASGDTQPPTAPPNLQIIAMSSSEVDLSWQPATDNVGVVNYIVERCSGASCSNFAPFNPVTTAPYYDTSATSTTAYSYRVHATDAAGNAGPPSNVVSTTTPTASPDCN